MRGRYRIHEGQRATAQRSERPSLDYIRDFKIQRRGGSENVA